MQMPVLVRPSQQSESQSPLVGLVVRPSLNRKPNPNHTHQRPTASMPTYRPVLEKGLRTAQARQSPMRLSTQSNASLQILTGGRSIGGRARHRRSSKLL